jgi:SynChlorMet cassette radical SAM/SPASM protein ScmF|uniref:SynChlorMet cassette radical SAM/SPASM protein ScmF n=1 Tax=Desulfobacca acetoxidans TaxID=60893 RepID=A0A7V6A5Y8_9BACT
MSISEPQLATPPLREIYFYLTEGCNLRCRHCWIMTEPETDSASSSKALLDLDLFAAILEQARPLGLTAVKLTGGEPFLHPQVSRMLELIRDADLKLVVETNAVLLTPELAKLAASCRQPFVSVSLDGTDPETHEWVRQVPGSYRAALRGIGYLVEAGIKPQIIFTIMQKNRGQVSDIVRLAQEVGAGSVKFNIIQPSPRGDHMRDGGESLSLPDVLEICRYVEHELASTVDLPLFFGQPPAFKPLKRVIRKQNGGRGSCGILGIIGVLANGSYALCGIGSHLPELVFGHACRDSLAEVWQNNPVLKEIRAGLPERLGGICDDCLLKRICLGFCLAQNYYHSRDLWSPYWFCQEARSAGLFPESRTRPFRA